MARFSPSTLLVWEDHSSEQIADATATLGDPSRDRQEMFAAARLLSRRQHEFMHYRQNVSTPLGTFDYRLAHARLMLIANIAQSLGESATRAHLALARSEGFRAIKKSKNRDAAHFAGLWERVEAIRAAFSTTDMPAGDLRQHVAMTFDVFHNLPLSGATELRMIIQGEDHERILPKGGVTTEMVSEGLARFHELTILWNALGKDSFDSWFESVHRLSDATVLQAAKRLRVSAGHPIIGAIHDVALSGCPDPGNGVGHVIWRSHYPGISFDRMLDALEKNGRARDKSAWNIQRSYEFAAEAAGTEVEQIQALSQEHADRLASAPSQMRPRLGVHALGSLARASTVSIAVYPETAMWGEVGLPEILVPPIVVRPEGVMSLWSERETEFIFAEGLIMLTFELLHDGKGFRSLRRILASIEDATRSRIVSLIERDVRTLLPTALAEDIVSRIAAPPERPGPRQ